MECATFHSLLLTTHISNWVTIPVQYYATLFQAGLAERTWWYDLRHWAVNNIPPGISEIDTSNAKRAYITSTVLHVHQELRQAGQLRDDQRDSQRVKSLHTFLRGTASQLPLPIHLSGAIVVPNLTVRQKRVITNILRTVLRGSLLKAYER